MARMLPAGTLPSSPPLSAVTPTSLVWHRRVTFVPVPWMTATGRNRSSLIENALPDDVLTAVPRGMVYAEDGSQFFQRTEPLAVVVTVRTPVVGKSPLTLTGIVTVWAGMTAFAGSTAVADGSARTGSWMGPTASTCGVTGISAGGRNRNAATAAMGTPTSSSRIAT